MKKVSEVFTVYKLMPLKEAYDYIYSIHGVDTKVEFDPESIEKYEVFVKDHKVDSVIINYNTVKVTLTNGHSFLWPIQTAKEELNLEYAVQMLKELQCL